MNFKIACIKYFIAASFWSCSANEPTLSYYERALKEFYRNEGQGNKIKWKIEEPKSAEDSLIYITLYSILESHIGDSILTHYNWLKNERFYELSLKDSLDPLNFMFINYYNSPKERYPYFKDGANAILSDKSFFYKRVLEKSIRKVIIPVK